MIRSLLLSCLLLTAQAFAFDAGTLSATLLENEVTLARPEPPRGKELIVGIRIGDEGSRKVLNKELLERVVSQKLSNAGVRHSVYDGDLEVDLLNRRLSVPALLSRKLIIEVDARLQADGYAVSCAISAIDYRADSNRKGRLRAHRTWHNRRDIVGIAGAEVDDAVVQYAQSAVGVFVREQHRARESRRKRVLPGSGSKGTSSSSVLSSEPQYRVHWNDPDNRRGSLFIGATFGTPALFNVSLGYWGSRSVPFVVGLSGMYFTRERRGIQADLGWAFDNDGAVKQAVSAVGALFNGTREVVTYDRDMFGRVVSTTIDTLNELHPYVGPAYTIRWNDFRLQGGAAFRMDNSNEPAVRVIISIGFTPAVRL